jgi:hydroxymethylglutaryl-CoA reductase
VFERDLTPWAKAQEALMGISVIPTAVIGPLTISLGDYELTEPEGQVVERGRSTEDVFVPLAHTEGSMSDSLYRGARAAAESGGFRTEVLRDRITRASCFVCRSAEERCPGGSDAPAVVVPAAIAIVTAATAAVIVPSRIVCPLALLDPACAP